MPVYSLRVQMGHLVMFPLVNCPVIVALCWHALLSSLHLHLPSCGRHQDFVLLQQQTHLNQFSHKTCTSHKADSYSRQKMGKKENTKLSSVRKRTDRWDDRKVIYSLVRGCNLWHNKNFLLLSSLSKMVCISY